MAIIGAAATYWSAKRDRRRSICGEATKAAVGWKEMLYRVRRRAAGDDRKLIDDFHALQDSLTYYQAWIGSDSLYMKRSYDTLVKGVKSGTEPLITAAWAEPIRKSPGNATPTDEHPDISELVDNFLRDVRGHLSPLPWRKLAVRWRNREVARTEDDE